MSYMSVIDLVTCGIRSSSKLLIAYKRAMDVRICIKFSIATRSIGASMTYHVPGHVYLLTCRRLCRIE